MKHICTIAVILLLIYQKNHHVSAENDVFLGGSCNPTTWRKSIAIPLLKKISVSYYNPQVDNWSPELIEIENKAKKTSRFLLWNIDPSTRNTVSMIEIAELATIKPERLVVVMQPYLKRQKILNEHISNDEYNELMNGLSILKYIVTQENSPIFDRITLAIQYIVENKNKFTCANAQEKDIIKFNHHDASRKKISPGPSSNTENEVLPPQCSLDYNKRHLYVGVEGQDNTWLAKSATKIINSSGLTFYAPSKKNYDAQSLPLEFKRIENSQVVLIVVSSHVRGMGVMILGARLISLQKKKIVLCIQDIPAGSTVAGEKMSETSLKDYNRARTYLKDMAKRANVPVYHDCEKALRYAKSLII